MHQFSFFHVSQARNIVDSQFYIHRDPMLPTAERKKYLREEHYFECKCESCKRHYPPFKSNVDEVNNDVSVCQLLHLPKAKACSDAVSCMWSVNRNELMRLERSATKYLESNEHPTVKTLTIQSWLMQIWNNLGR